jgi:hypothetical protein
MSEKGGSIKGVDGYTLEKCHRKSLLAKQLRSELVIRKEK